MRSLTKDGGEQMTTQRPDAIGDRHKSLRCRGVTLLELMVVIAILALLAGLTLPAVQRVRASAAKATCADHLRQLGVALHAYHDTHGRLPPGTSLDGGRDPYPYLSWLARLLPHVEQAALWQQTEEAFRRDRDFLTPTEHPARGTVVPLFLCLMDYRIKAPAPVSATKAPVAFTSYLGVAGRDAGAVDGLLYLDSRHRFADVKDGTSSTLLAGERPPSDTLRFGWWYAGWGQNKNGDAEVTLGVRSRCYAAYVPGCEEGPYHFTPGRFDDLCDAFHFWSPHPSGAHFAFADGSVRFLRYHIDPLLPALATRAGGESVALND